MVLMKEIGDIVAFFGKQLNLFLKKFFLDLAFLAGTLLLMVAAAWLNRSITRNMAVTILVSALILIISEYLKKKTTFRKYSKIQQAFLHHTSGAKNENSEFFKAAELLEKAKNNLGARYKSFRERTLLVIINRYSPGELRSLNKDTLKSVKSAARINLLQEILATGLLSLPFLAVLVLYSLHTPSSFMIFLFMVGLAFIFFLHSAVIKPVFNLLLDCRIREVKILTPEN
jgi:hypothetical protein